MQTTADSSNTDSNAHYSGYGSDFDITPLNIEALIQEKTLDCSIKKYQDQLWHQRVLFIAGSVTDKKQLARQIANQLKEQVFNVGIFEIHAIHPSAQKITDELKQYSSGGIFIFQGIKPSELGFCYEQLLALTSNLFFFIFTTEVPQADWYLPNNLSKTWCEITDQDIAPNPTSETTPDTKPLLADFTQWFDQQLTDKDRQLVMGGIALYGLNAPQLFAILDRVPYQGKATYFDYSDVKKLTPYLQVSSDYIEVINDQLLTMGLNHGWQTQPRYLKTLLAVSMDLIAESLANPPRNRELFGTAKKKEQVRNTLSRLLGFVLVKDTVLAEEQLAYLINLNATDGYAAAGKAVAHFYAQQPQTAEKLMTVWVDEKKDSALKKLLMATSELTDKEQISQQALEKIRTLLAFSFMFIANQFPANQVPETLKNSIVSVTKAGVKAASLKEHLGKTILKSIYKSHFSQFEFFAEELVCKHSFHEVMPDMLSTAMADHTKPVWALLHRWVDLIDADNADLKKEQIENNKHLITVALKTIGKSYKSNTEYAVELLNKVLANEKKIEVRSEALQVCMSLVGQGIKVIDHRIESLIAAINVEERIDFIKNTSKEYLKQRKKLSNGDIQETIDGEKYHLWLSDDEKRTRPTLEIEKTLADFIAEAKTPEAAQLAYLAESSFVNTFEKTEQSLIKEYKEKKKEEAKKKAKEPEIKLPPMPKTQLSWFSQYLSIPMTAQKHVETISAILPAALEQSSEEQQGMVKRMSLDGRLDLALALERVLLIEKFKPEIFLITFIVLVFIAVLFFT